MLLQNIVVIYYKHIFAFSKKTRILKISHQNSKLIKQLKTIYVKIKIFTWVKLGFFKSNTIPGLMQNNKTLEITNIISYTLL